MSFQWDIRKWGYKEYVIGMFVPGVLYGSAISINYLGAPVIDTHGVIVGESDAGSLKRGEKCRVDIETQFGSTSTVYYTKCSDRWRSGDEVSLKVIIGRLNGSPLVRFNTMHLEQRRDEDGRGLLSSSAPRHDWISALGLRNTSTKKEGSRNPITTQTVP